MKYLKAIIIFVILSVTANAQFKWNFEASYGGGYESNIFKSPRQLEDNGQTIYVIKSDLFYLGHFDLDLRYYPSTKQRIRVSTKFNDWRFEQNKRLNQYQIKSFIQYINKFGKNIHFSIRARMVHAKKIGTDIYGDGLTRIFNYSSYDIIPELSIYPKGKYSMDLQYLFKFKNYDETGAQPSLDYRQNGLNLNTCYYFNKYIRNTCLTVNINYLYRQYNTIPSLNAGGQSALHYPPRAWHLYQLKAGYLFKLFKLKWGLYSRFRYRKDTFENYYTYRDYKLSTRIKGNFYNGSIVNLSLGWRHRDYLEKRAAQSDIASQEYPKLNWKNMEINLEIKQRLYKRLSVILNYELDQRDTNVSDMRLLTNRDYLNQAVYGTLMIKL